jgi:hypothetical protein
VASGRFGKLEREGHQRIELEAVQAAPPPPPVPAAAEPPTPDPIARAGDPLGRSGSRDEPGFGTVLASGVLVACIMALVSIPVRHILGTPGDDSELLTLVVVTLAVYLSVRRKLHRL